MADADFQNEDVHNEDEDEDDVMYSGQIARAPTQVTGVTNAEPAKELLKLSTLDVKTQAALSSMAADGDHIGQSDYVPSVSMFSGVAGAGNHASNASTASNPTFAKPTAARSNPQGLQQRYRQRLTLQGDGQTHIEFGKLHKRSNCVCLIWSFALAIIFCYVAVDFFPVFQQQNESLCESSTCIYSVVPPAQMHGILQHGITLISFCDTNWILFEFAEHGNGTTDFDFDAYTFDELEAFEASQIASMFVAGTGTRSTASNCWNRISNDRSDSSMVLNGFVHLNDDGGDGDGNGYSWSWTASGWFITMSILMAIFFIILEWLFYSYNEIMIPRTDYTAYLMWYLLRIGWMSFMLTIVAAHALLIDDGGDVVYLVSAFDYVWLQADCYIASAFVALFIMVCCCCCCFQEVDTFSVGGNSASDQFGVERYFLPKSRIDMMLINEFEQALGTAMCTSMLFVIGFIVCGCVPFYAFLRAGLSGYTYFTYLGGLWLLAMVVMTLQMCWYVRAKCCGDAEDRRQESAHNRAVSTQPAPV